NGKGVLALLARLLIDSSCVKPRHATLRIDLVGPESLLRQQAIHHQVAEGCGMAASLPDFRVHNDGGLKAHDIVPLLRHRAPPAILEATLEFGPQRAVI